MKQAQSGKIDSFIENHRSDGKPRLQAAITLDVAPREEPRQTTVAIMTPEDLENGLKSSHAMMSLKREDMPFTYEEQKSASHFTASSQSLSTKGVEDTRFAEGIVAASPNLTSETFTRAMGKADGGVVLLSPVKVGNDPASLAKTIETADAQRMLKSERDTLVKEEKPRNLRLIQGGVTAEVQKIEDSTSMRKFDPKPERSTGR